MALDEKTVRRVAHLARIALPEARVAPMVSELNAILAWIEQLNEVDIEGAAPMSSAVAADLAMREDIISDGGDPDAVLANAPKAEDGFFVVPKVVE